MASPSSAAVKGHGGRVGLTVTGFDGRGGSSEGPVPRLREGGERPSAPKMARSILNPFSFHDVAADAAALRKLSQNSYAAIAVYTSDLGEVHRISARLTADGGHSFQ